MRAKYNQNGPDIFADHELLEMLLYHSQRQGNTNPTSHALLEKYPLGGIGKDISKLSEIHGIGECAADLLRISGDTTLRLLQNAITASPMDCDFAVSTYLWLWFLGKPEKCVAALMLNSKNRFIGCSLIAEGRTARPEDYAAEVVSKMTECGAKKAVICHNHADGDCSPSLEDLYLASYLERELSDKGLTLLGNYIATQSRCEKFCTDNK